MALYFKDIEITNIDNLVPQSGLDVTDIWFCSTNVYTVWEVYEGTLPATINANGDDMRQYQIYGNTGGVGDVTENIFTRNGETEGVYLAVGGNTKPMANWCASAYIPASPNETYTFVPNSTGANDAKHIMYDSNHAVVGYTASGQQTFTTTADTAYIRFSYRSASSNITLTEGTTPPASFVPYGYEVDMGVSDGTTSTTTPIYIGDTPLEKDEYIDCQARKVFRRTEQLWNYEKITVTSGERYGIIVPNGQYSIRNDTSRTIYYVLDYEISGEHVEAACAANSTATLTAQSIKTSNVRFYIGGTDILQSGVTIVKGSTIPSDEIPYYQPTDPPVALPALPTCEGTTIVDYAGSGTAPEKVLLKYRKENF